MTREVSGLRAWSARRVRCGALHTGRSLIAHARPSGRCVLLRAYVCVRVRGRGTLYVGSQESRAGGRAGPVLSPVVWCALKSTARALNGQPSECGRCACAVRRAEAFSGQSARRGRPRWYEPSRAGVPSVNLAVNHLSTRQLPQCLTSNFFRRKILFIRPVPCPINK